MFAILPESWTTNNEKTQDKEEEAEVCDDDDDDDEEEEAEEEEEKRFSKQASKNAQIDLDEHWNCRFSFKFIKKHSEWTNKIVARSAIE